MTTTKLSLADALMKAAMAEREGHSFYMMAANTTTDPKGKQVFEQLAHEEMEHLSFLKTHYESVQQTGKLAESTSLNKPQDFAGAFPIFSEDIKARLASAHFEMSALAIGIQLELDAMKFYKEQSETTDLPEARKFFAELAAWETGHYQTLLRQQEQLKGDYWSDAGFSPF